MNIKEPLIGGILTGFGTFFGSKRHGYQHYWFCFADFLAFLRAFKNILERLLHIKNTLVNKGCQLWINFLILNNSIGFLSIFSKEWQRSASHFSGVSSFAPKILDRNPWKSVWYLFWSCISNFHNILVNFLVKHECSQIHKNIKFCYGVSKGFKDLDSSGSLTGNHLRVWAGRRPGSGSNSLYSDPGLRISFLLLLYDVKKAD